MAKKKYSAKERKAYATAKAGKRVKCPDKKTEQSFKNGVNAVKGRKPVRANSNPLYVVDGNGVVLKVLNGG